MPKKYDIFILCLSIYIILEVAVEIVVGLPKHIIFDLFIIDTAICIVFLFDWFWRFSKSVNKRRFLKKYWIDLIASIPIAMLLHPLRVFSVIRILRSVKAIRGIRIMTPWIQKRLNRRASSALIIYVLATTGVYFYCSLGLYNFEKGINPKVIGFGDAMWLAFTSLTTVGYGDIYPVTWEGRIFAGTLILIGMGLFSLMTAEFATYILSYVKNGQSKENQDGT